MNEKTRKLGLLSYSSNNIGDDLQTFAMQRWLRVKERDITYLDRNELGIKDLSDRPTDLILNAFLAGKSLPIKGAGRDKIRPYFVAIHLHGFEKNGPPKYKQLRRFGPVGCRDIPTLERCQKQGIKSYYSGCPTALLSKANVDQDIDILLIDVNPRSIKSIPDMNVRWATNMLSSSPPLSERMKKCRRRWKLISRANMVVTSKLHAAMPALAMGKSVVFIKEKIVAPGRLSTFPKEFRFFEVGERFSWNPDDHRYDLQPYKRKVEESLLEHIGHLRRQRS